MTRKLDFTQRLGGTHRPKYTGEGQLMRHRWKQSDNYAGGKTQEVK